jgi:class 3 adenylate cyclase/tetratricopeptide (TPR) repeat protein
MTDIQTWLESHGLARYAAEFLAQDITVDLLRDLSDADLRELGMASLGDRKRFLKAATEDPAAAAVAGVPVPAVVAGSEAPPRSLVLTEEGERRHATVMFSDLTGYTALNEAFDPEEVEEIMSRIKREAIAVIERHGGRVNQFVGDEVMAMFGVPVARRDDARRAIRAALELHRTVDGIAAGVSERLGRVLSMHTGLHTGLVIARRSDSRSGDYTLTGDTVNTAARLRGLAQPGEVVVSPQTWQQVSDHFEGEAGQAIEVKGKERPLVPYRIVGERAVPKGGMRPLVGRAEEVQQFETLVHACLSRHRGRIVFVRGDPGLGKSRLVAEFLDLARERGLVCHATTILDFGARTGHDAIRKLMQSLMGLAPDADEASRRDAIVRSALRAADGADLTPFMFDLLDVTPPAPVRALLSAVEDETRRSQAVEALGQLVRQQVALAPTLLLIEDIHWADPLALRQFGPWLALTAGMPLLVMFTTRFAGDPSVGEWRSVLHSLPVSSMDLGPLEAGDAMRLAAGAATISDSLLRSCVERAEGNPLFLEQLLLNAGDEGATSLPGSIQALIQARMDRLAPPDKNALQAAAVLGQSASLAGIRHLLADPAYDPVLLVDQFLLRPEGDDLVFCHALIRDGAYASLLHARRRQLHQEAAAWILPQDAALAAEHYERAEDARAADAYLQAVAQAAAQYHFAEALELVQRALRLPDTGERDFALKLKRSRLLLALGHAVRAIEAGEQALEVAPSSGERALALIAMASGMRYVDRFADGLDLLAEAEPLAQDAGLTLELSRLHELRGNLLFTLGRARECLQSHEMALELARKAGSAEAECAALGGVGDALYAQGRVLSGGAQVQRCVEMGFLKVEIAYLPMVSWSCYYMLDVTKALEVARRAVEQSTRMKNPRAEMMARSQLVMIDGCICGNFRDNVPHIDRALELATTMGSARFIGISWFFRAMLFLRNGDTAAAREYVRTAFDVVQSSEQGMAFIGPQLYGAQAMLAQDPAARAQSLAAGDELLRGSLLSHNYFTFYDFAIQASVAAGEWDTALHYCNALEAHTAAEGFPWAEFIVARGRALTRHGQGERSAALKAQLQELLALARERRLNFYAVTLGEAVAAMAMAPD